MSKPVPPISKPAATKPNSRTSVSKGKPSATLIHQQQQHEERRASVHKRTLPIGGKSSRNSEESDASEESSSESVQIPPPKMLSPPTKTHNFDSRPDSEMESNGGYSDAESLADHITQDEPVVEPPLKVPPLKLIFKVSQPQPLPVPEKVVEKKSLRKARTRYTSDQSEPEIVEKKVRTRLRSNTSENEVELGKVRTRYTSNNSENGDTARVTRNRLKSNTSETEVPVTSKARTRYASNNSENELVLDYSNSRASRRNRHENSSETKVPAQASSNIVATETFNKNVEDRLEVEPPPQTKVETQPQDDEPTILRHPSRTRTYGSRSKPSRAEPQNSTAPDTSTTTSTSANALRLTRRNPLPQIEEEATDLSIPSEPSSNHIEPLSMHLKIKPLPKVEEVVECKTIVKEENCNSARVGIKLKLSIPRPAEVVPLKTESQDQLVVVDLSPKKDDSLSKPVDHSPDTEEDEPSSPKPETAAVVSDLNDVPDVEEKPSSLTRARTIASGTNIAGELKYSYGQKNRFKR